MKNAGTFLTELQSGALNGRMIEIYGCDPDKAQGYADRFAKVIKGFQVTFPKNAQAQIGLYSAPGRTEIGGNHTALIISITSCSRSADNMVAVCLK